MQQEIELLGGSEERREERNGGEIMSICYWEGRRKEEGVMK